MTASALALSNLRELAQAALANPGLLEEWSAFQEAAGNPDAILALLDQLDAAQEALRLADAALLFADTGMRSSAPFLWNRSDWTRAVAAARARQEEP